MASQGEPPRPKSPPPEPEASSTTARLKRALLGRPRDFLDPGTYRHISLVALLAWVGLGADGLSSSAYGPDETFRALGEHRYLAVAMAAATAVTILVISVAYSQIIKRFPFGGGGYVVATKLLGPRWGLVSGSALVVDYVLTISVSVASGADQVFSVLPPSWRAAKLGVEAAAILALVVLNLRGVRESVTALAPIFGTFVVTHLVLIGVGVAGHAVELPRVAAEVRTGFASGYAALGLWGMLALFMRAYSMGAGTYTGIEAVSNGLQIMREPKVATARRTMTYMSLSLAITATGILLLYMLFQVAPEGEKTLNAVLLERFAGGFSALGLPLGRWYVWLTLGAEAALLFVAAQAGFLDGPRVMANMAIDSWMPHRFAQISDRLVTQNGVLLMGGASLLTLFYTRGDIVALVTMYAINVFVTFSLSQASMLRYWLSRRAERGSRRGLAVHGVALVLCLGILAGNLYEKGREGGWVTVLVTALLVGLCLLVRNHYRGVQSSLRRLNEIMGALPAAPPGPPRQLDPRAPTAVLLVGGYGGLGIHALLSLQRVFPGHFRNVVFASVGVIDSAAMKGVEEVESLRAETRAALQRYVFLARRLGLAADLRDAVGTEAVTEAEALCRRIAAEFPRAVFFAGKLVFQHERWYQRLLHNETAYALQRRLQFAGLNAMVLPVRVIA